jgi:hypothetical protein
MRIVDCHVHTDGAVEPSDVLRAMDANGVERCLVMSGCERESLEMSKQRLLETQKLVSTAPERLGGLAWFNPTIEGSADLAEEALTDLGFTGIKIIPDHWYATEERLEPF